MDEQHHLQVKVSREGDVVGSADVTVMPGAESVVVALHCESGHVPPGTRKLLVDEVLALPEVEQSAHVSASVPRGDAESLRRLHERCTEVTTHSAGATVIVDGTPPNTRDA